MINLLGGFIIGSVAGYALGLLCAPKPGKELVEDLTDTTLCWQRKLSFELEALKQSGQSAVHKIEDKTLAFYEAALEKNEELKEKADELREKLEEIKRRGAELKEKSVELKQKSEEMAQKASVALAIVKNEQLNEEADDIKHSAEELLKHTQSMMEQAQARLALGS